IVGGKLNGTGKITLADGGEFEGTFVDNRLDKGMAKNMKLKGWSDDCRYTGQMAGGELNGTGTVTSAVGDVYEGVFVAEYLHGPGKITFAHGEVHEGVFDNNSLKEGKLTFPDGEVHEGVFESNGFGPGTITSARGCEIKGDFAHGKNSSKERARIPDLRMAEHTQKTFANGIVEEGTFVDGSIHKGKVTFPDPEGLGLEVHEGVFVDGCLNGHCKVTTATFSEEGNFVGGELNGPGTLTYADGGDELFSCVTRTIARPTRRGRTLPYDS
ncbi:hypothetical protein THAOC_01469, partial [Thalassiosira oceanica]